MNCKQIAERFERSMDFSLDFKDEETGELENLLKIVVMQKKFSEEDFLQKLQSQDYYKCLCRIEKEEMVFLNLDNYEKVLFVDLKYAKKIRKHQELTVVLVR